MTRPPGQEPHPACPGQMAVDGGGTMGLQEALGRLLALPVAPASREVVSPLGTLGRYLAEDVIAPAALPRRACAAMDGYALADGGTDEGGAVCRVIGQEIAAGQVPRPLAPGEVARISTGALVPAGADRVVPQESAVARGGRVAVRWAAGARRHIRLP